MGFIHPVLAVDSNNSQKDININDITTNSSSCLLMDSKTGKIIYAKNAYEKIIEINKEHYLGYMKLSSLSFTMGNKEEAKEYLKKTEECSNLSPNDPQYLYLKKNLE